MSMFENEKYRWRETYFVLFDANKRPTLDRVVESLSALNERFEFTNRSDDGRGMFDSLTVVSADDFAALDVCYSSGAEVLEQAAALVKDAKKTDSEVEPPLPWEQIRRFDGRLDVLHFERVVEAGEDDEEMVDPSALLLVLGALARLTGGVAVDPQTGTLLTD
ncbi:MAG: hypothetical protein JW959_06145 [Pirellulales bacterium]|nr:hypothetical protein [Pirellulales bacterium]